MTETDTLLIDTCELTGEDLSALSRAVDALEKTTMASRITNMLGRQIAVAGQFVPARVRGAASRGANIALRAAMGAALRSLRTGQRPASSSFHKAAIAASGAAGGALGFVALPFELPTSTILMLRAIADVARAQGEDMDDPATALACLEVFALGGRTRSDDHLESSYFAVRALLARSISEASRYIIDKGVVDEAAPILVKLASKIAARFGVALSQKFAAQAIPIIGAMGGAAVNLAFLQHFEQIAEGHFTVRRLERVYGSRFVKAEYERLRTDALGPAANHSPDGTRPKG
jgi:hypothetical protein